MSLRITHRSLPTARRAASILETIISLTLLSSTLAFSAPLFVKHQRLMAAQREYRLALDEVSNQIERITILPESEVSAAIEQLRPSDLISEKLARVKLDSQVDATDAGRRLTVRLSWGESELNASSVALTAWLAAATAEQRTGGTEP